MKICDNDLSERCKFFNANYNAVYTYLQSQGRTQPIIDSSEKVCRFCGKRFPEVKFKQKAHAIPELIGNKEFVLYNECDNCNALFGKILENDLGNFLGLGRTLSQIVGKDGVPSYKTRDGKCRIDYTNQGMVIQINKDSDYIETKDHTLIFHGVRDAYTPLAVYKALVKMALSLIPFNYLSSFTDTIKWIMESSHEDSLFDMNEYEYIIERYVPGPKPLRLKACGFIRNNDSFIAPYYQFLLEFANYSYQIVVPCKTKDELFLQTKSKSIVLIPNTDEMMGPRRAFGQSTIRLLNMSSKSKIKNEPLDIYMHYDSCEKHEGNGQSITEVFNEQKIELNKRLEIKTEE